MHAGFASVDITPDIGTPIAGNFREDNRSHGVYHEICARSSCLFDGNQYVVLTSVDLCAIAAWQVAEIRRRVAESTPVAPDQVTVAAIHSHSGPITGLLDPTPGNLPLVDALIERICRSIREACGNLGPVTVRIGRAFNSKLPHNRRVWCQDGRIHMNWEKHPPGFFLREAGEIDPEILTLSFWDPDQRLKGLLVNYALHPAILAGDNNLTSADYVGFLARYVAAEFSPPPEILFLNGAEGNINHLDPWNPNQTRGFKEAERIGRELASGVLDGLARSKEIPEARLATARETITLPRRRIAPEKLSWAKKVLAAWDGRPRSLVDGCPDEVYAQATLDLAPLQGVPVESEIQAIRIGEVTIVTLPGEFFVEYGLKIKSIGGKGRTIVVGLANDRIGYVPTPDSFSEGGYETVLGRQSYLDEKAGDLVLEAIGRLLDGQDGLAALRPGSGSQDSAA